MNVEKPAKSVAMSDVAIAADRIRRVAGARGYDEPVKVLLDRAYDVLSRHYPHSRWTRRRVRALWRKEAARVDYHEIAEMEMILAARKEHAEFVAETERMAAAYLRPDPDFYSPEIEARRSVARGVDRPGAAGGER